jgi:hypothetical protein
MKQITLMFFAALLAHGTAFAQDKSLYDISRDTLSCIEAYTACADPGAACTEGDARSIQTSAKNSLADLYLLIASGNVRRMMMTADEARTLSGQANTLREQFMTIELLDAPCNQAIILVGFFMRNVYGTLVMIYAWVALTVWHWGAVAQAVAFLSTMLFVIIPGFIIGTALILGSFVVLAPCLFWWL